LPEGGDVNKLLRLIGKGKALAHMAIGKREAISGEQVTLETRANIRFLEWCLADNISEIRVKRSKKARSLLPRVPR
jgi:hypothetical protein